MVTCKDSTKTKDGPGVCSGHGGKVKPAAAFKAPAGTPATAAPDTKKKKPAAAKPDLATITAAPGGGREKVWVNLNTGVFHRQGDEKYGKTKRGIYMSEAEALKSGYHADSAKSVKKP